MPSHSGSMNLTPLPRPRSDGADTAPQLEIVIPVYNEARQLAASVTALRTFLDSSFPLAAVVTIADNASTDDTWTIAAGLAASLAGSGRCASTARAGAARCGRRGAPAGRRSSPTWTWTSPPGSTPCCPSSPRC